MCKIVLLTNWGMTSFPLGPCYRSAPPNGLRGDEKNTSVRTPTCSSTAKLCLMLRNRMYCMYACV